MNPTDFSPEHFLWSFDAGVATITLNRPERKNPLTFESYAELRDTFRALVYAKDVKAVVLAGAGGNFSSGGDVFEIIGPLTKMDMPGLLDFTRMTGDLVKAMRACPQPIVAALDGVCVGAGAIMAMASDIRLATPRTKTAFLFTRVGLAGCDMGACAILPRIIGQGRASELLFTGRVMTAEEGERWGFHNRQIEPDAVLAEAQALARELAAGPTFAHGITKTQLAMEWNVSLETAIEMEAQAQAICMQTQDFRRAFKAFAEKRTPVFEGIEVPDRSFLDWPFFDHTHRAIAAEFDTWCAANLTHHHGPDVDAECRALVAKLAADGWLRYAVPAAYGGVTEQLDVRTLCLIRETLARHSGLADFVFAMQGLGSGTIQLFGTDAQKARWLPAVAHGQAIAAFALTELKSGSDVAAMDTTARLQGDQWTVDGAKTYISNGGIADFYVLFARTGEAPGAKGISAFIVDKDAPGLEIAERIAVIAPHPLATLRFNGMKLPADALLGEAGRGFAQAMANLDIFRPTVGAAALGFARRALDEATERAMSRELFGARLADNPITQSKLAEMALDVDASALLVYRAAWTRDTGQRNTREAAMAKLFATEAAQQVIDKAVQMFGGLGVVSGVPVEQLYREVRALRIYEGASEVQKIVIARQHLAGFAP